MKNFTEFNKQADQYAKFRPRYPQALFEHLASLTADHDLAFDVGTGNGQCAVDLSIFFKRVVASDLSQEQISHAIPRDNVEYFVAPAHLSKLPDRSTDLVTVATAIHWFDFDAFYAEVQRILKPDGVLAAWAYGWHQCEDEEISKIFLRIGQDVLGPFWSPQPKLIWDGYRRLPFPFAELPAPKFSVTDEWNLAEFIGYLSTWSASQKYIEQTGRHPAQDFSDELHRRWKDPERKLRFTSPLHIRIGRHSK